MKHPGLRDLSVSSTYQGLCWAVGMTTTSRGIRGQTKGHGSSLCGRKYGAKQDQPHRTTVFGGTE